MAGSDRCDFCERVAITAGAVWVSLFVHLLRAPCILPQSRKNEGCLAVGSLTCLMEHSTRHPCSPTHPSLPGTVSICHRHTGQQCIRQEGSVRLMAGSTGPGAHLTPVPQKPSALSSQGSWVSRPMFPTLQAKKRLRGNKGFQRLTSSCSLDSAPSRQAPAWLSPPCCPSPVSCLVPGSQQDSVFVERFMK